MSLGVGFRKSSSRLSAQGPTLGLDDVREWMESLGLSLQPEQTVSLKDQLRDGVLLCQLVNKIRPGSVELIKTNISNGNAEENVLRFLQACTTLGVKRIFRPVDILDSRKDFGTVLVTLQFLLKIASELGLGLPTSKKAPQQNGTQAGEASPSSEDEVDDEVGGESKDAEREVVRALYAFSGTSEDELNFDKGDLITITNKVEGGWWEGVCNGKVGWFPGSYAEAFSGDPSSVSEADTDSVHHYHNLVIKDILDSERAYVHDLHTMMSVYLVPLKSSNIVTPKDVEHLTGNLPELSRWQQSFFKSLEDCSKLPVLQQNMGTIFFKMSQEIDALYTVYCTNHPMAVAVLTENSDKLSAFMESKGATSPGMLTLTANLSKPFLRLEKYPGLLKELERHLTEGHPDTDNVAAAIETYTAISKRTQEIRKRKEMEHEMLSNPVKGFRGSCLNELGECACVIQASQAVSAEEVSDVFYLVFPSMFVVLEVGPSLSGYEMKNNFPLATVSIKKGQHTEHWPWPVELLHKQETIHASLSSDRDLLTLIECVGRLEGVPNKAAPKGVNLKAVHTSVEPTFRSVYPSRAMRRTSVSIKRDHHWGFKSLRPPVPLKTQQLLALKERDKSPKSSKKFIYPTGRKKRTSKHLEELLATSGIPKGPVENKPGDTSILRVIEAYCAGGKGISKIQSERPLTYINPRSKIQSNSRGLTGSFSSHSSKRVHSTMMDYDKSSPNQEVRSKSSTLPGNRSHPSASSHGGAHLGLPGFPYRPPSPILSDYCGDHSASFPHKSTASKRSIFRKRAGSVDTYHKV